MKKNTKSIIYYVLGFIIIGLGVNLMNSSDLGVGAWDTVTINLRGFMNNIIGWQWVTIGMMSFLISTILMITILLYHKKRRYLFLFVPVLLVFGSIDFWNKVVFQDQYVGVDFWVTNTILFQADLSQYIFFLIGSFILPLGLTLVVKSGFPAFVFDELMLMIMDIVHAKTITVVRLGIEITGLLLGTFIGYITFYQSDGDLGSVNWGTLLFTILFSTIMGMWFTLLKVKHND